MNFSSFGKRLAGLALGVALLTACNGKSTNGTSGNPSGTDNSGMSADSASGGMMRSDTTSTQGGMSPANGTGTGGTTTR